MKLVLIFFAVFSFAVAAQIQPKRDTYDRNARLTPDTFIIGGTPTTIDQYPHSLALLEVSGGISKHICGASIIARFYALSAFNSCFYKKLPPSNYRLRGGSTNLNSGGYLFNVQSYEVHPKFNDEQNFDNDVVVIRASDSTPFEGTNVKHLPLPRICNSACCGVCVTGTDATVAGWGTDKYVAGTTGSLEILHRMNAPIYDFAQCNSTYYGTLTSRMFCLATKNGITACTGDEGSAAVRDGIQVGIVSFGFEGCDTNMNAAVYTRIEDPVIRNFIAEQARV